jgi:hypothetical protein
MDEKKKRARERALRAARAVTIAAAMAMPGCAQIHSQTGHDGGRSDGGPLVMVDAHVPYDGGHVTLVDAHVPGDDAGARPDAGECPPPEWTCECEAITQHCCTDVYFGWWNETESCCMTCAVGPMVPPSAPV